MGAGTKYDKELNKDKYSVKTPAFYDANVDEWLMGAANAIQTEGGLFIFQKGTDAGRAKVDAEVSVAIPAGANVVGKVGIDQTTPGTTNKVVAGIDQTTPGTTNKVVAELSGSNVKKAFVITPDDVNDLAVNALSLSCTEEGLVYVDFVEGGENVPIKLVPGLWNPANVKKVHATNTTALGIIGQEA